MHIPGDFLPAPIILHQHGLEATLKQVAAPTVPPIEPDTVADAKPLHGPAEIGFGCFEQQMIVIVHQDIAVDPEAETLRQLAQQLQEMKPVAVVAVNGLLLIASGRNMITTAGPLKTQRACHATNLANNRTNVK